MTELRNLQATGLTSIGQSLRTAFDLLNLNRLVTGIDNYGQVRSTEEADRNYEALSQGAVCIHRPHSLNGHFPQFCKHQPHAHCENTRPLPKKTDKI